MRRASPIYQPCDQSISLTTYCTAGNGSAPSLFRSTSCSRKACVCVCARASVLQMPSMELSRLSDVQKFPPLRCDSGCPLRCRSLSPSRHPASHEL
ncbi:hypothetical protein CGRA01v4_10979 [Colletotrichum graminicola]|nr:hypothetical protein CGRA01v4_10979 [Colletotrichum graminicola]